MTKKAMPEPWESLIIHEPAETYHQKSKLYMSSHQLSTFRKCPRMWKLKHDEQVKEPDSDAYRIGRAAHVLILEGREAYEREFLVSDGPMKDDGTLWRKNATAYKEWAKSLPKDKELLSLKDSLLVERMAQACNEHIEGRVLLTGGVAEGVIRKEVTGVHCQIRMDYYTRCHGGAIHDLKTTRSMDGFLDDCMAYDYLHQFAFYTTVAIKAGLPVKNFYVHAVEKCEPFRFASWRIPLPALWEYQCENDDALAGFKRARERDEYPTMYEGLREWPEHKEKSIA